MAEGVRRRRKLKPVEEAIQFSLQQKDKNGLEGRFISHLKGRSVFSCTDFEKGDFLLEYRGDLISKEECERRQRIYHHALKVFMFEFRYNGKLLCVDAARDDGSLGRLVNDDHINPNSRMKTIRVDGKPHLCLFATRSICPGEEITYDYGDSEWPWRCTTLSVVEPSTLEVNTLSQSEDTDVEKLKVVSDQSVLDSSICAASEGLEKVTLKKDQLLLDDQDCVEKMSPVKEHVLNEEQSFCAPVEGVKEVCRHVVVTSAISSMDKCAECVGPVAALKWIGLRCKLCSSFWHKSCYLKFHEWDGRRSSCEVSSEEDELSDEDYIPQSESDHQSDSSDELTTRPARYDQAKLLDIQEAASSKFSEHLRSDVTTLNVSKGKGKGVLKVMEAASVYDESDLMCHEEQFTDFETDSESDFPRKQGSVVCRSTDVLMSSPQSHNSKLLNSKSTVTLREERERSMAGGDHCVQSPKISCSANRKNYCYICGKPQSKLARHLKTHMAEVEVVQALSLPVHSKERKAMLQKLRNKGNFQHNTDVLQSGEGALKIKRAPKRKCDSKQFLHCMYCKGLFVRRDLWRHLKRCPSKPAADSEEQGRRRVLGLASMAESSFSQHISQGVWKLLGVMKQDDISAVVKNDLSILQLAQSFFNKHGHDPTKFEYIRQKLREVGRLLLTLRRQFSVYSLEEALKPANFHRLIRAVQMVSGYDDESHCYQSPSLALKLGHSLNKICEIIQCRALMSEDKELISSTETFKKLYSSKWSEMISHTALVTLNEAKFNKPSTLPFTQDVQSLHQLLEKTADTAFHKLQETASPQSYAELAKATLTRIIVFNRRRAGEVSKMPLKAFNERDGTSLHEDVAMGLSKFEQKLCSHFSRVEIRGKRGRKVAVLLSPDMVDALMLLVSRRGTCGVLDTNTFLFARPNCQSYYRGQDSLRVYARECGAQNPEFLRSTHLRKHVATLSQILNLKNNELDQVADFLGHDIRVHRDYYRLPEATTQLAKISKLLLAMEKGCLPNLQGKSLDDIEIEDEINMTDSDDSDPEESESDDEALAGAAGNSSNAGVQKMPIESTTELPEESESEAETENPRRGQKVSWSNAEVTAVMKHFKGHIAKGKLATLTECQQCKSAEDPVLVRRSAQNIRDFVRNRGISLKRKTQSK
ncbi:uncharacterized protein LOC127952310 [Carassius gibelio]|uniref:uncharacterized protein LOC127952310 n=1 Tax=Carassius gibelio TaxID=101364 RepID=UPI0022781332|nr:uncharacterized protein LOC127952310 [Carassius gibelio]